MKLFSQVSEALNPEAPLFGLVRMPQKFLEQEENILLVSLSWKGAKIDLAALLYLPNWLYLKMLARAGDCEKWGMGLPTVGVFDEEVNGG